MAFSCNNIEEVFHYYVIGKVFQYNDTNIVFYYNIDEVFIVMLLRQYISIIIF